MMRMESTESNNDQSFRNAKRLAVLFFVYAVSLPFVSLVLPGSGYPPTPSVTIISWVVILMMPMELVFLYVIYWVFRKRSVQFDIMGPAVLMFVVATVPSIYTVVIGLISSPLRYLATALGLIFSLVGLWLSLRFLSALEELVVTTNQ
jgi:hypothetical protein